MRNTSTASVVFFGLAVMVALAIGAAVYVDSCPEAKRAWLGLPQAEARGDVLRGKASWYSRAECCTPSNPNALMADNTPLRDERLTCAALDWPLGTRLCVTHGARSVVVTVRDRGPAKRLRAQGRVVDLTMAAYQELADLRTGVIPVEVQVLR